MTCRRLLELAELQDEQWGRVGLDACHVCQGTAQPDGNFYNDVLAALLFQLGRKIVAHGGTSECSVERANSLIQYAHGGLRSVRRTEVRKAKQRKKNRLNHQKVKCDVVLNFTRPSDNFAGACASILNQQGCELLIHLVTLPDFNHPLWDEIQHLPQIRKREVSSQLTDLQAVQTVLSDCCSNFIAIQSANTISQLSRISDAVNELQNQDGDLYGSDILEHGQQITAELPRKELQRTIPVETFVFRRTTFIDLEGIQDSDLDDVDFAIRCYREHRKIILSGQGTVVRVIKKKETSDQSVYPSKQQKACLSLQNVLNQRVRCDVVLPFRDDFDFVEQAIESILAQKNCDVILHLVDDNSRSPVDPFFHRWNQISNIRCYQNIKNLGQYTSFNNVIPYAETDYLAIQDGDDLSIPTRISDAVNRLQVANADIFSGAMQVFGATEERASTSKNGDAIMRTVEHDMLRHPKYPNNNRIHFALNGGVVMKTSTFKKLGGFTDFGSSKRNRAGLDTEFYLRAYHSRFVKFFISRKLVLRCRRHAASATQTDTTGFGSPIRTQNQAELQRRKFRFHEQDFDPKEFGALGRYQEFTQPWEG